MTKMGFVEGGSRKPGEEDVNVTKCLHDSGFMGVLYSYYMKYFMS